mmetsp:Transcript_24401/g.35831  ORF Transcript_24401/g.35831 Transcript_24401/m.35831 type:complete len:200 (-) Transcript_24401:60-659(-)
MDSSSSAFHSSDQHMHAHHTPQHAQMATAITPALMMPPTAMQTAGMQQSMQQSGMQQSQMQHHMMDDDTFNSEEEQANVEYILAKQYKSLRTGNVLGFPAYNAAKEILGFYRESSMKVGIGQFIPISRHKDDFGPSELAQAKRILEDAIVKKSQAVHAMKDWGSLYSLIDHALVYDWSKDMGEGNDSSPGTSPTTAGFD